MSKRGERRKRLDATAKELVRRYAERTELADGFLKDVDVTEEMVIQLTKKEYPDPVFQRKWNRFIFLTDRINFLKELGGKFIELRENNKISGGMYGQALKDEFARRHN